MRGCEIEPVLENKEVVKPKVYFKPLLLEQRAENSPPILIQVPILQTLCLPSQYNSLTV